MAEEPEQKVAISLGDRQKGYEAITTAYHVDLLLPVVVRLDGKCFHTFTKGFQKPYDARLRGAMVQASYDFVRAWPGCAYIYTQSDEATAIFPPKADKNGNVRVELGHQGRLQKSASIMASFFTARFNHHLALALQDDPELLAKKQNWAYFDARLFNVPSNVEATNNVLWRLRDWIKNSKAGLGQYFYPAKTLHGLNGDEIIAMVKAKTCVDWHALEDWQKYGTIVSKTGHHSQLSASDAESIFQVLALE